MRSYEVKVWSVFLPSHEHSHELSQHAKNTTLKSCRPRSTSRHHLACVVHPFAQHCCGYLIVVFGALDLQSTSVLFSCCVLHQTHAVRHSGRKYKSRLDLRLLPQRSVLLLLSDHINMCFLPRAHPAMILLADHDKIGVRTIRATCPCKHSYGTDAA